MMLAQSFTEKRKDGIEYELDSGNKVNGQWVWTHTPTSYAVNPAGWFGSVKIDGVRAKWNPKVGFFSRNDKRFEISSQFFKCDFKNWPDDIYLDGELVMEDRSFSFVNGLLHKKTDAKNMSGLKYKVFDVIGIDDKPFVERIAFAMHLVSRCSDDRIEVLEQYLLKNMEEAHALYRAWIEAGHEGMILRDPNALYEHKRSYSLLKWKPTLTAEAMVIGYDEGTGKNKGRLGSFHVQLLNSDITFHLSGHLTDSYRNMYRFTKKKVEIVPSKTEDDPIVIGDLVTFEYMALTDSGTPRQPILVGMRRDI